MFAFMCGAVVGMWFALAVIYISIKADERKEKKEAEKERRDAADRNNWKYVHNRITSLADRFTKELKSHETSIAILTARSDSVLSYVDASVGYHEAQFHRPVEGPKEGAPKPSPRKDNKGGKK